MVASANSGYRFCPLFVNSSQGDWHESVIVNIRISLALFSFIGSLFVLLLVWLFKKYKFFTQRLILYISIAALISSVVYMLGRVGYHPHNKDAARFCKFSGFLLLYSDWTVLLATLMITVNLLLQIASHINTERLEIGYVFIIFGFPLMIAWIPFTKDDFGPSGAWCWIKSQNYDCTELSYGRTLQFTLWYIPLYTVISIMFLIYLFILYRVRYQVSKWYGLYDPQTHRQRQLLKEEIKPLLWYPIIYFCVQLLPFINRIVINATEQRYFSLYLLHVMTSPLTGVLIAFAYALDKETMKRINWRSIKINVFYRSTDQVVHPYFITQTHEEEPTDQQSLLRQQHNSSLVVTATADSDEGQG